MADNINTGGGGNTGLAVLVGALVVGVLVIAFFLFGGNFNTPGNGDVNIDVQAPQTEPTPAPAPAPTPGENQ